jgi:hypothetical protein
MLGTVVGDVGDAGTTTRPAMPARQPGASLRAGHGGLPVSVECGMLDAGHTYTLTIQAFNAPGGAPVSHARRSPTAADTRG